MKYSKKYHKIFNWEYWPSSFFYIPNLPYAFYLAWRAKKLTFFTAANPSIKSSGNGTESKYETIQLIPEDLRPKSLLVKPITSFNSVLEDLTRNKIIFPLIAKPDIGFRGLLVKKIKSESELKNYLEKYKIDIIIQEYVDLNNECGIFYVRNPKAEKGKIASIKVKLFKGEEELMELDILASEAVEDVVSEIFEALLDEIYFNE